MKNRIKTGAMMCPEIIEMCDKNLHLANCDSRNDFIENAVKHYSSFLNTKNNSIFLSEAIESVIKSSILLTENRLAKLLFKLAVELSMLMNIIAASNDIDTETLTKLRGKCIKDVK